MNHESVDRQAASEQAQPQRESLDQLMAALEKYDEANQARESVQAYPEDNPPASLGKESIERQILSAIQQYSFSFGKAQTGEIAYAVNLSRVQTWRYLKKLAALGIIQRIGERGGWITVDNDF